MLAWIKKHRILFVIEVLCLVLLLPGCFAKEKVVVESTEVAGTGWHKIEGISLQPGVYCLEAEHAVLEDAFVRFNIVSETATYMALRYNEVNVTNQSPDVKSIIYVTDSVKDAYIECAPAGSGNNQVTVSLLRLNFGNRIALFYAVVGSVIINLLLGLRERILSGRVPKENLLAGGILVLAVAVTYYPYATDYFSLAGNLREYLTEIEYLSENCLRGIGNNPYLLPAVLLRMVGLPLMTAYKLYLLLLLVATATMTYYGFKRCTGSVAAAAFGGFLYTVSPYFINTVYGRQTPDEIAAMAFLPLVLCGIYCLMSEKPDTEGYRSAKFYLVSGMTGVLQSNLGIAWVVLIMCGAVCLILFRKSFKSPVLVELLKAIALCVVINVWTVIPRLMLTSAEENVATNAVANTAAGMAEYEAVFLNMGVAYVLLFGIFVACLLGRLRERQDGNPKDMTMLCTVAGACAAIVLGISCVSVAMLCLAAALCGAAAAFFVGWLEAEKTSYRKPIMVRAVLILLVFLALQTAVYYTNDIALHNSVVRLYDM